MANVNADIQKIKSQKLSYNELLEIAKKYNIQVKSRKERLEDALIYLSKEYIPYPKKEDNDFFKKIYMKKEFYENKYKNPEEEKGEDIQKKLCPSTDKKFQLLPHQVILRNYMNFNTPYNGVLVFHGLGSGKCHKIDTPILMNDGSIKMVQDVQVGDLLMGDDSTPRKVLSLGRGKDTMYEIKPIKGESFTVNSEHILCLKISPQKSIYKVNDKRTTSKKVFCAMYIDNRTLQKKSKYFETKEDAQNYLDKLNIEEIVEIEVNKYLELPKNIKSKLKLYRTSINFQEKNINFDPYIIGFWLGDGCSTRSIITTQDSAIIKYLKETLPDYNCYLQYQSKYDYRINTLNKKGNQHTGRTNKFMEELTKQNLIDNKHIPNDYKINSRKVRLQVLAGLIDSDGSYSNGTYEFCQKNEKLTDDVVYLARSLGFAAYKKIKKTSWTYKGVKKYSTVFRVIISGDIDEIPVKIKRKMAEKRKQKKNVLVTGFKVIEKDIDNYYGFTLDRNNRYVIGDFTVTHNTCSAITIAESYKKSMSETNKSRILVLVSGDTIEENFRKEIHSVSRGYNQCTFSDYINYNPYDKAEIKQKKVDNLIDKNYEIEHYQKLSNIIGTKKKELTSEEFQKWIEHTYSNRVFIIDEVHNLKLRDKDKEINTIKRYEAVMLILKYSKNMKLVLLSGTPMSHTAREIIDIMNLLLINDNYEPLKGKEIFDTRNNLTQEGAKKLSKIVRGYVSYIIKENPYTFPEKKYSDGSILISEFIEKKFGLQLFGDINISNEFKIVPCIMGKEQRKRYLDFISNEKSNNIQDLIQLQLIDYNYKDSNSVYKIDFDKFKENNISKLSIKFYKLLQNIKKSPGPIFIYSNYKEKGIYMIASMLLKNGIDLFNSRGDDKSVPIFSNKFTSKRNRPNKSAKICAVCAKRESEEHDGHKFTPMYFDFIIGQTTDEVQRKIIQTFNNPDNYRGEKLKIIIGSSVLKEGVSFFRVRQLHIMEPWHNKSRLEQVIGRGLRHCSHKDLKQKERNIEVSLYCSVLDNTYNYKNNNDKEKIKNQLEIFFTDDQSKVPIEYAKPKNKKDLPLLSYDAIMYKRAEVLDYYIKQVELLLKRNAFDCALNKELNIDTLPKDEQYMCASFDKKDEFELTENDIDLSTYDNIFLTPYIKYTISIIKSMFEKTSVLYEKEIRKNNKLLDDIYQQNDYYVIRKALDIIIPKVDNMKNFQHIITHKRKYGYIFVRKIETDNIYIFKEFEDQQLFVRSEFEVSPIYENMYQQKNNTINSFKTFLNILERNEKQERGKQLYLNTLKHAEISGKKKTIANVGNLMLEEIKRLDPIKNHKNDGDIVALKIMRPDFDKFLRIRQTILNIDKKGEDIKQYHYGQECLTHKAEELQTIIRKIWKKVNKNSDFYKNNLNKYDLTMASEKPMKKKANICKFLYDILEYLNNNKVDGKIWLKKFK
jgi:hypothetical protein